FRSLRRPATAELRPAGRRGLLFQIGLLLSVLPAVPVSISSTHQAVITPGVGYLPEYFQAFGVGLILATMAWSALSRWSARGPLPRLAVALLFAAVTGITYRANGVVIASLTASPGSPLFNVESAK